MERILGLLDSVLIRKMFGMKMFGLLDSVQKILEQDVWDEQS